MNIVKFGDGFCVLKCSLSTLRAQNTHLQIILSSRILKFSPAALIILQLTNSEPMTFSSKLRVPHLLESLELCNKCNLSGIRNHTNRESLGKDTSAFPDELWGTAQDRIGHHRIQYNPMNMNPCPHVISNSVLFHSNLLPAEVPDGRFPDIDFFNDGLSFQQAVTSSLVTTPLSFAAIPGVSSNSLEIP